MKETRKISMSDVRTECIKNNWYTNGDCEAYDNMLTFVNSLEHATTNDLEKIATDIKEHSTTDCEIEDIMFGLANDCCITVFERF
jgi:hypothetical protein